MAIGKQQEDTLIMPLYCPAPDLHREDVWAYPPLLLPASHI